MPIADLAAKIRSKSRDQNSVSNSPVVLTLAAASPPHLQGICELTLINAVGLPVLRGERRSYSSPSSIPQNQRRIQTPVNARSRGGQFQRLTTPRLRELADLILFVIRNSASKFQLTPACFAKHLRYPARMIRHAWNGYQQRPNRRCHYSVLRPAPGSSFPDSGRAKNR